MSGKVIAIVLTGAGVLLGVWRIVIVQSEGVRRDLRHDMNEIRQDIRAMNSRIDNTLLAAAPRPPQ